MDGPGDDFAFLAASARRKIERLRDDPRLIARGSPTADTPPELAGMDRVRSRRGLGLIEHVTATLNVVERQISEAESEFPGVLQVRRQSLLTDMRLWNRHIESVHRSLSWLEQRANENVDVGVEYFIDEAALAIVGAPLDVVAVPTPAYMYSVTSWPFKTILDELDVPVDGPRPVILNFPQLEAHSALLHPIFAHELGHPAAQEHELVGGLYDAYVATVDDEQDHAEDDAMKRGLGVGAAESRAKRWIEEALCDAFALQLLGPTYLLAFASFILAFSWNAPEDEHPPTTLRLALLIEHARRLGWEPILCERIEDTWAWLLWAGGTPPWPTAAVDDFAVSALQDLGDQLREVAADRVGENALTPASFEPVQEQLQEFFRLRILPVEIADQPTSRPAILLGGWLYALSSSRHGDAAHSLATTIKDIELQRFIAKALEMSTVLEVWRSR